MVIGVQFLWNFKFGGTVLVQFLLGGTILENNLIWGYAITKTLRTPALNDQSIWDNQLMFEMSWSSSGIGRTTS
jgi:hypothetical protein